ncbi:MAG: aminotransferase class I/II-fold pyridoxal phosphate-dependent enzyme [Candidatus Latescibacteria bacterium]|nr:aminotransferase class I/II-fold pyridoxal phosphate-dependent enzyme [Candidatus Latescibacterota bacterium]
MGQGPYIDLNLNAWNTAGRPSAQALVDAVKQRLAANHLAAGCRMPPVRVLAHQLGLSKNTVQRAYDELVAQGLFENRERVGLFLASPPRTLTPRPRTQAAAPALVDLPPLWTPRPSRPISQQPVIGLSGATIDAALLPTEQFDACLRAALKDRKNELGNYPDPQGFYPLRKQIANRLNKRGIPARAEDIVTTLGSQQCLDIIFRVLDNRHIAVENPAYSIGRNLLETNGAQLTGLPLDPFRGLDLDDWERRIAQSRPGLLYLIPHFQNPTGYCYSESELDRVVDISRRYGCGLLEDDWGSDMLSYSEFRPALRARGGTQVLYMNSFTKKLLPSMRLGYIVGDESTTPTLVRSKEISVLGTPLIIEAALFEYLDRGYYDVHLKRLNVELDRRYQNCLDLLRQLMPEGVKWTAPGGGPTLWLEVPTQVDLDGVSDDLAEQGVMVRHMDSAFFGRRHLHGFRLCFAHPTAANLQRGLELLAARIKEDL